MQRIHVLFTIRNLGPLKKDLYANGVGLWTYHVINKLFLPPHFRCSVTSLNVEDDDCRDQFMKVVKRLRPRCCVPLDFPDAYLVASLASELNALDCKTLLCSNPQLYMDMENKAVTSNILASLDIPHPKTWIYPTRDELPEPTPDAPLYVKRCAGTNGGSGVIRVETDDALLKQLNKWHCYCVVTQESISGSHATSDCIFKDGKLLAAHFASSLLGDDTRGRALKDFVRRNHKITNHSLDQATIDRVMPYVVKIGERMRLSGPMNIDFLVSDDEVYVLEFNPRLSGTIHHAASGPLLAALFSQLLDEIAPPRQLYVANWEPVSLRDTSVVSFYLQRLHEFIWVQLPTKSVVECRLKVGLSAAASVILLILVIVIVGVAWKRKCLRKM